MNRLGQDPALMRPSVEEVGGLLHLRFDTANVQSAMRLSDPSALVLEYTRTMMRCLLFNAAPKSMLMIGLGGGSLAKYCHTHLPQADITAVEINPHVIDCRERFQVPPDGPLFRAVRADGAAFAIDAAKAIASPARGSSAIRRYDAILVDAFHAEGAPAGTTSRVFFKACRSLLSPRGVLAMNLESEPAQCQPTLARMGEAFGGAVWSVLTESTSNRIAFAASAQHLSATLRDATARLAALAPVHRDTLTRRDPDRLSFAPLFA